MGQLDFWHLNGDGSEPVFKDYPRLRLGDLPVLEMGANDEPRSYCVVVDISENIQTFLGADVDQLKAIMQKGNGLRE